MALQAPVHPLKVGDHAADFTLPTHEGTEFTLSSLFGTRPIVLFFYPKDHSAGCTAEVCSFRDSHEVFKEQGAEVIGVSSDSVDSHARFVSKHRLPYLLLSDKGGRVRALYGVEKSMGILPGRVTYVIDREGVIRHVFSSQIGATKHVGEALQALNAMK